MDRLLFLLTEDTTGMNRLTIHHLVSPYMQLSLSEILG